MDKKGYIQLSEEKILGFCKCCGKKATARISVGNYNPLKEIHVYKDDGTTKSANSDNLYLCDNCKENLTRVLLDKKYHKDMMGKLTKINTYSTKFEGKNIESVFDIFDVDKMNEEKKRKDQ